MSGQTEGAEAAEMVRGIWRDAAERGIKDGIDWPAIVLSLFRSLDDAAAREAAAEARGAQRALLPVERFAQAAAVTARANGRGDEERLWLDLLILTEREVDRAAQVAPSRVPGEES